MADQIKVPMLVRLYAGDVLVAEVDSATLFSSVMGAMLPKPCGLCHKTPKDACCHNATKDKTP